MIQSIANESKGKNPRQESEGRNSSGSCVGMILIGLLPMVSQSYTLYNIGPRNDTTHTDLGSPISIINQESPRKRPTVLLKVI